MKINFLAFQELDKTEFFNEQSETRLTEICISWTVVETLIFPKAKGAVISESALYNSVNANSNPVNGLILPSDRSTLTPS